MAWQESPYISSDFESSGRPLYDSSRTQTSTREDGALCEEEDQEAESDDPSNMEVTKELRQYFSETEKHREERRRWQNLGVERLGGSVNAADCDLYCNYHPSEKPGAQRQAEMSAPKILAIEASIQLSFDKKYDRKQPVVPVKF